MYPLSNEGDGRECSGGLRARRSSVSVFMPTSRSLSNLLGSSLLYLAGLCSTRSFHAVPTGIWPGILQSSSLNTQGATVHAIENFPNTHVTKLNQHTCSPSNYRHFFKTRVGFLRSDFGGANSDGGLETFAGFQIERHPLFGGVADPFKGPAGHLGLGGGDESSTPDPSSSCFS